MEGQASKHIARRMDLIYPELSYAINGVLFSVHNQLGGGHHEKYYQKAVAVGLRAVNIPFVEQYYVPLQMNGELVGKYYLDFLIDGKIVLELKRGRYVPAAVINQTKGYLQSLDLQLGLLACFAHDCVVIKRIINVIH